MDQRALKSLLPAICLSIVWTMAAFLGTSASAGDLCQSGGSSCTERFKAVTNTSGLQVGNGSGVSAAPLLADKIKSRGSISAYAGGAGPGGGGNCEDRFKGVADELEKWIRQGGAGALQFADGETAATYADTIKPYLANYEVHCVGPNDRGFPVEVGGVPKECKNEVVGGKLQITCDEWKFYKSLGESKDNDLSQYRIVNHEFASGAGLEPHTGSLSTYFYSHQLTPERILLSIKPYGGSVAIKLTRFQTSQVKSQTSSCQKIVKTVKGFDNQHSTPRLSISEASCVGSESRTYSVTLVSESGVSFTSTGIGLPESSGLPGSMRDLSFYDRIIPEAGLKMQGLFHQLQNKISCRIVVVSSEGTLVNDSVCQFAD